MRPLPQAAPGVSLPARAASHIRKRRAGGAAVSAARHVDAPRHAPRLQRFTQPSTRKLHLRFRTREGDSGTSTSTASPCRPLAVASTAPLPEKPRPLPDSGILESPLAPSLSALESSQADRSAPQASLPGQSLFLTLGWTCDTQCFSVTSPSRWKRSSARGGCSSRSWSEALIQKPFHTESEVGERGAEVPERRLSFLLEFIPCLSAFFPSSHTFEIFFESSSSSQGIILKR
ncbi:hypothetical protein R6Z07F_013669 [Ovis aries]